MENQIFADGLGHVAIVNGTVRFDFFALSPTEKDANGQPKPVVLQQVIMAPDGFLRMVASLHEASAALLKLAPAEKTVPSSSLINPDSAVTSARPLSASRFP